MAIKTMVTTIHTFQELLKVMDIIKDKEDSDHKIITDKVLVTVGMLQTKLAMYMLIGHNLDFEAFLVKIQLIVFSKVCFCFPRFLRALLSYLLCFFQFLNVEYYRLKNEFLGIHKCLFHLILLFMLMLRAFQLYLVFLIQIHFNCLNRNLSLVDRCLRSSSFLFKELKSLFFNIHLNH